MEWIWSCDLSNLYFATPIFYNNSLFVEKKKMKKMHKIERERVVKAFEIIKKLEKSIF